MEIIQRKLSSIPKPDCEISRKPTLKASKFEKIAAFKRRSSSCCGFLNTLNENKTIRNLLKNTIVNKLAETVKDESKVLRLCSPLKKGLPSTKDQGIESKNTGDATNKQLEDADGCKESVSNSFSESSSDQSSPSKTLHIQNNHIITLRRPQKEKDSSQAVAFAYNFSQGKDVNSWSVHYCK